MKNIITIGIILLLVGLTIGCSPTKSITINNTQNVVPTPIFALLKIDNAYTDLISKSSLVSNTIWDEGTEFIWFSPNCSYRQAIDYVNTLPHSDGEIWQPIGNKSR